jgi:hypothetical protein
VATGKRVFTIIMGNLLVSSLFRKKLMVIFISMVMFINGFALSAGEISRHSIVLIAAAVTYEMIAQAISKCGDSLTVVSNKVSERLKGFIFDGETEGQLSGARKGEKKGKGQGSQEGAAGKAVISEFRKNIEKAKKLDLSAPLFEKELFKLYSEYKIPDVSGGWILLLVFIMFIIGIRQRKGLGEIAAFINDGNNKIGKIKISA